MSHDFLDSAWRPIFSERRSFARDCEVTSNRRRAVFALSKPDGIVSRFESDFLPASPEFYGRNLACADRLLKFLLWQRGAGEVRVSGIPEITAELSRRYSPTGKRAFDAEFFTKVYGGLSVEACDESDLPQARETARSLGRNWNGCRIGFDLGGSDRKCAAVKDGEVLFTEEIRWDPYFEKDPEYHWNGIRDSLNRAAAHLPRVDAIGGSSAGVYVDNEPRVASLFRGIPSHRFENEVRPIFHKLKAEWGGVPFEVVNDGDVTALAGSMGGGETSLLGVSMGTSMAVGYVDGNGHILPWLNELAFAPFDMREDGPVDEWSGDSGVGAQYFSQQGVARLAGLAGLSFAEETPFAERLVEVQRLAEAEDARALAIYRSIGRCFACALAQCGEFYDLKSVMALGRVTSGAGGELLLTEAREELARILPEREIRVFMPGEKEKRHGQAVAAASLPEL